jgi:hypothetical protein
MKYNLTFYNKKFKNLRVEYQIINSQIFLKEYLKFYYHHLFINLLLISYFSLTKLIKQYQKQIFMIKFSHKIVNQILS